MEAKSFRKFDCEQMTGTRWIQSKQTQKVGCGLKRFYLSAFSDQSDLCFQSKLITPRENTLAMMLFHRNRCEVLSRQGLTVCETSADGSASLLMNSVTQFTFEC